MTAGGAGRSLVERRTKETAMRGIIVPGSLSHFSPALAAARMATIVAATMVAALAGCGRTLVIQAVDETTLSPIAAAQVARQREPFVTDSTASPLETRAVDEVGKVTWTDVDPERDRFTVSAEGYGPAAVRYDRDIAAYRARRLDTDRFVPLGQQEKGLIIVRLPPD
jgi:hypothetical protein